MLMAISLAQKLASKTHLLAFCVDPGLVVSHLADHFGAGWGGEQDGISKSYISSFAAYLREFD